MDFDHWYWNTRGYGARVYFILYRSESEGLKVKTISVWIDGEKIETLSAAYGKLGIRGNVEQMKLFNLSAKEGSSFDGHIVSFFNPGMAKKKHRVSDKPIYHPFVKHDPLLPGLCTHRLGAYKGESW
jgi:hypothetical protein